jgi:aminoglycoside phosphotransferase (APT) family kinase protein
VVRVAPIAGEAESSVEPIRLFEDGLGAYLSDRWKAPTLVTGMTLVPGGAARATWRCSVVSNGLTRGLIVRVDSGTQLLPTNERTEYLTVAATFKAGFPVPEPLFFEEDVQWLGRPFSIVSEVPNCNASPDQIPHEHRDKLGQQFWSLLGGMAKLSPQELGIDRFLPATDAEGCAIEQLRYWWDILKSSEIHPNPIAHAGFSWLDRNLPPPAQRLCLVHGDYRTGNYLYSPEGEILALLDWEMAHIGDPLEDLAWSLDLRQNVDKPGLAGGLISNRDAIRFWQEASGLHVNPSAFRWWQVFSAFKALAIWTLSAKKFQTDEEKRPVLGRIGWLLVERQQRILLDYISPISSRRGYEFVP